MLRALLISILFVSPCFGQLELLKDKLAAGQVENVELAKVQEELATARKQLSLEMSKRFEAVEKLEKVEASKEFKADPLDVAEEAMSYQRDAMESIDNWDTIQVFTMRQPNSCPPCERWKKEMLSVCIQSGWKVKIEAAEEGLVPRFIFRGVKTNRYLDQALMSEIMSMPADQELQNGPINPKVFNARSAQWSKVRAEVLKKRPCCEACGRRENLAVHHVKPFHENPEFELVEFLPDGSRQLVVLCVGDGTKETNCHLNFGHDPDGKGPQSPNWKLSNPNVVRDAEENFRK